MHRLFAPRPSSRVASPLLLERKSLHLYLTLLLLTLYSKISMINFRLQKKLAHQNRLKKIEYCWKVLHLPWQVLFFQKNPLLLILSILLLIWLSTPIYAQDPAEEELPPVINWRELETENFIIVYAESIAGIADTDCACGLTQAQRYVNFIDEIYLDLVSVFNVQLDTPINIRLFPTNESYYEVNPLARQIPGVVAHALNNRAEIAIALPRTQDVPEEEIVNNIRHELTHFFASLLSDSKLNNGFQEGIAQYLEKPSPKLVESVLALEAAYQGGNLLPWAEMNKAEQVFGNPAFAYPEALSITAFLIDRYSFAMFIDFMKASATEPGYRSAMEMAYGISADQLEAEWQLYLPEFINSRWQINSIYAYDLGRVTKLVNNGAYTDAETELIDVIALLESTDQTETLALAETLLAKTHQGQAAGLLADEARQALQNNDYPFTIDKSNAAIVAYQQLGYQDRIPELQNYIHRANLGQGGLTQLQHGQELLDSLHLIEAEQQIYEATVLLQSLDNQDAAQQGEEMLVQTKFRQRLIPYAMLLLGLLLLIFNGVRRLFLQYSANPLEVEYS